LIVCRAWGKPLRQNAGGEKSFIMEKLRHDLHKASQPSSWPVSFVKKKVACLKALAPTPNYRQIDPGFSENSAKFSIHGIISPPLQKKNFITHLCSCLSV
jgi:hypothetical protein